MPIRCFTCGAVISQYYEEYADKMKKGEEAGKILDGLEIKRYCCRRMFLANVNIDEFIINYRRY